MKFKEYELSEIVWDFATPKPSNPNDTKSGDLVEKIYRDATDLVNQCHAKPGLAQNMINLLEIWDGSVSLIHQTSQAQYMMALAYLLFDDEKFELTRDTVMDAIERELRHYGSMRDEPRYN